MKRLLIIILLGISLLCQGQGTNVFFASHSGALPVVVQYDAVNLSSTSINLQYTVDPKGLNIIAQGVCYDFTIYPTLTSGAMVNSTNTLLSSPARWEQYLTELIPNTKYYFDHYATGYSGTAYDDWGGVRNFTTTKGYGYLYNWYAAIGCTDGDGISEKTLAPSGWHVPTYDEYVTLVTYLTDNGYGYGGSGDDVGKSVAWTSTWDADATAGRIGNDQPSNNASGFSAFPGGYRNNTTGAYTNIGKDGWFWTTTDFSGDKRVASMYYSAAYFYTNQVSGLTAGFNIRLIKDDSTDPGILVDYDGTRYSTVKIGNQVWMKSNLVVTHYTDGTSIPEVTVDATWAATTSGARCVYSNDATNK
jgi:uncharacterized protein (TIGR02145 family)